MDVIESFQAKLQSGRLITIRHIQKYVELEHRPVQDGTEFRLDTGEVALQFAHDAFVVLHKGEPHEWATRIAQPVIPVSLIG